MRVSFNLGGHHVHTAAIGRLVAIVPETSASFLSVARSTYGMTGTRFEFLDLYVFEGRWSSRYTKVIPSHVFL